MPPMTTITPLDEVGGGGGMGGGGGSPFSRGGPSALGPPRLANPGSNNIVPFRRPAPPPPPSSPGNQIVPFRRPPTKSNIRLPEFKLPELKPPQFKLPKPPTSFKIPQFQLPNNPIQELLKQKEKEKEKIEDLKKQPSESSTPSPILEIPSSPYSPPPESGYDHLPESPTFPSQSSEIPSQTPLPPNTWSQATYSVKFLKAWVVRYYTNDGDTVTSPNAIGQDFDVEIEILDFQSFGFDFAVSPGSPSGFFAGEYYVKAKGIRGAGRNIVYPAVNKIYLPYDSSNNVRFSGNSGAYPVAWDIWSFGGVHIWYSPGGATLSDFKVTPPQTNPPVTPKPPDVQRNPPEDEKVCDLSPVQQSIRHVINQNNLIQASVNGAQLGINANIDTLKPPLTTAVNNTGQILNVTGTTQTTVNSTASQVNAVKNVVDDIPSTLANHGNMLNNISGRVQDTFNKVGEVLTKMGERFDRIARWLRLPQLLSALTLIVTLHNAAMLSSNLIQSLGEVIDIGLNVIGLKDENDQDFNIGQILGKQANDLAASILGTENWNSTKETWKKLSNIYKAGANVIYSIQSITDSMISILQIGAEATGKIGNALRKAGVVAEDAFNWLPETINLAIANQTAFRGVLNNLRNLNDTADSLGSAVSETRNIQTEFNEMKEKKDKFDAEVKKVTDAKTATETTGKTNSQTPTITPEDLVKPST